MHFLDHVASIDRDGTSEDDIAPPVVDEEVDGEDESQENEDDLEDDCSEVSI